MKIYLIRHGQTTSDVEDRYGGDYDDHLTKEGIKQVKKLANKLDKNIQMIFHSPKIRTTETAKIVSKIINSQMKTVEEIRERNNYGILTGMKRKEAKIKFSEEVKKLINHNHDVKGSENYDIFKKRIINSLKKIFNTKYDTIAIITHGGVISCFNNEILKLNKFKKINDCAFLELEKIDNKIKLISKYKII
jgi:broad specificity phosphatase PhoE